MKKERLIAALRRESERHNYARYSILADDYERGRMSEDRRVMKELVIAAQSPERDRDMLLRACNWGDCTLVRLACELSPDPSRALRAAKARLSDFDGGD